MPARGRLIIRRVDLVFLTHRHRFLGVEAGELEMCEHERLLARSPRRDVIDLAFELAERIRETIGFREPLLIQPMHAEKWIHLRPPLCDPTILEIGLALDLEAVRFVADPIRFVGTSKVYVAGLGSSLEEAIAAARRVTV